MERSAIELVEVETGNIVVGVCDDLVGLREEDVISF